MKREVGGCIAMGHTCKPVAVSFQCMTKSTTNKKKRKKKSGFDFIYNAYVVIHAVGVISFVHRLRCNQSYGFDYTDTLGIMSDTFVLLSFIHHVRCLMH